MLWIAFDPRVNAEMLGFLPHIFDDSDPRPAIEQVEDRYNHGGGWNPIPDWCVDPEIGYAQYPGDAPLKVMAVTMLRDEKIMLFPHSWVAIIQPDGSYEMSRMD